MSAAIDTLAQRAKDLGGQLEFERISLVAHERGALRKAREELSEQESIANGKRQEIKKAETALSEINSALHALRGTRAIADRPQA